MKVLIVNTLTIGGAAVAALRLVSALKTIDHVEVRVLMHRGNPESDDDSFEVLAGNSLLNAHGINFVAEKLTFLLHERDKSVRFQFSLANFGTDISNHEFVKWADVIHLHWVNAGFLSLKNIHQLGKLKKPLVWTMHDMWLFTGGCHHARNCDNYLRKCGNCNFLKYPKPNDISRKLWNKKNALLTNSPIFPVACSRWLMHRCNESSLFSNRGMAIPNPIDTNVFKPTGKVEAREILNLPKNRFLLLFSAMSLKNEYKGFSFLKDALGLLKNNNPETFNKIDLLVMGESSDNQLTDLGVPVHNLGLIRSDETIISAYNASDFYVTPSLEENLPNTIMEALACGIPSIGFKVGGIPEMISDRSNGFLVDFKDTKGLQGAIREAVEMTDSDYHRMSEKCREKALSEYTYEIVAQRYLKSYADALNKM